MGINVVGHRVLLEPIFDTAKTDWDFVLDVGVTYKAEQAATEEGRIVSIGPNAWKAFDDGEHWAEVGDCVIFAKHGGKFIKDPADKDKTYIIINDEDIQCVITEEDKDA